MTPFKGAWAGVAAFAFGLGILALAPGGVPALNDDFGYLRSVVETLRHGHPVTDDWLEPWAASLSVLAAAAYRLTGSFYWATYGVDAAAAAVAFLALAALARRCGCRPVGAILLPLLFLTNASVLWKLVEFTSVPLYLACFAVCLLAWQRQKWGLFFCAWLVGAAARQSALAWLAMPLLEAIVPARGVSRSQRAPAAAALAGGVAAFAFLSRSMNETHARAMISDRLRDWFSAQTGWANVKMALVAALLGTGAMAFIAARPRGGTSNQPGRVTTIEATGRSAWWRIGGLGFRLIAAGFLLWQLVWLDPRLGVSLEQSGYDGPWGLWYCKLVGAFAAAGWLLAPVRLAWRPLVVALPVIGLAALRPNVWDYYLIELPVLGGLAVLLGQPAVPEEAPAGLRLKALRAAALGAAAIYHAGFVLNLKCDVDRGWGVCDVTERAIRAGRITPTDLGFAPFGLIGWYWNAYYIAHAGRDDPDIAGFQRYVENGRYGIGQSYSPTLRRFARFQHTAPADKASILMQGKYSYLWLFSAHFYLVSLPHPQVMPPALASPPGGVAGDRLPLNDTEWRALINATGGTSLLLGKKPDHG